ncbi:hypothetical protein Vretimale_10449 [Volvox reticuliferus]|uniref:Serine aminopeptidase S33 domain-containing protein n=1 Tax=Volvox reticuliferus TaxID=1737510 RepID=A0A8J4GF93_9CHLO|nr:hypothetical protein Vretifemale_12401 [Volvox reticuliferus]GIM06030.1 hypothetical protein Vretimale_10449 [Volvox reticuliferus]
MPGLGALWDSLVDCICRPPRDEYIYPDELVGGSRRLFRVGRYPGIREDLTLTNKRGLLLQCSHYLPKHVRGKDGRLPCVIYCHCNSGSRRDAEEAICVLIPCGVSVFTLDFAGSGLSEGQWVTLGAEEVDDVATVVEYLRGEGKVSTLGLWGRSMGAVTALLYSHRDPSIAGMVLDSPFARLTDLMLEIVQEQRLPIPRPLAKLALAAMKRSVIKRAGFDITKVSPVDAVSQSHIPALFGHAIGDTFIRISHAEALHEAYAGEKELLRFDGDHNSRRPEFFYSSVSNFWHRALLLEHLLEPADVSLSNIGPAALAKEPGGSSAARGGAGRPLRPPPPRLRHTQANPELAAAGRADGGDCGGGGADAGAGASIPADGTAVATAGTGRAEASSVANGGDGEEEEGADVAAASKRSAPWEPRLWELDADKAARERQRFRRMAGGLPSPAPAAGGTFDSRGGSSFRNSAELARLFATSSDESLAARLLGVDPQWSDGLVSEPVSGTTSGTAAASVPPTNGGLVKGLMAAALLLPTTEEEEAAQLRAALQLSLLETTAVPPPHMASSDIGGCAAAAGSQPSRQQDNQEQIAGGQMSSSLGEDSGYRCRPESGTGNTAGSGLRSGQTGPGDGAASSGSGTLVPRTSVATSSTTLSMSPDMELAGSAAPVAVAAVAAVATKPRLVAIAESASTAASAAAEVLPPIRSSSEENTRVQTPLEVIPSAALSGPPRSAQLIPKTGIPPALPPAAMMAVAATSQRPVDLMDSSAAATAEFAVAAAGGSRGLGSSRLSLGVGDANAVKGAAVPGIASMEAAGLTLYDLYTEDELMALAMQLSLQEGPASMAPVEAAGAAGTEAAASELPSLI